MNPILIAEVLAKTGADVARVGGLNAMFDILATVQAAQDKK